MLNEKAIKEIINIEEDEQILNINFKYVDNDVWGILIKLYNIKTGKEIYICGALNDLNANDIDVMQTYNTKEEAIKYINSFNDECPYI